MSSHRKNKSNISLFISAAGVVIILVIAFQIGTVNSNLSEIASKLDKLRADSNSGGNAKDAGAAKQAEPSQPEKRNAPSANKEDMKDLADDDPFKGDENAPVTIIEWSDFQCPFCSRFYSQTLPQLEEEYIETGRVKLVYRDFPLSFHPFAQKAAEAAECADDQGKFWEFHNKIFDNQRSLSEENLKSWAEELGLDTGKFNKCLDSGEKAGEVKADMQAGAAVGIRGTPGFIINGRLISGAQPYSVFKQAIEEALGN